MSFDEDIQQAVRDSLVKMIRSGDWLKLDYSAKLPIDTAFLRRVQNSVNLDNVLAKLTDQIESRIAEAIFNAMATEIATDVKKILSNMELREDVRAILRAKIRNVAEAVK
jgi:uncharacterized membrane protein YheB (UPF0754 family)